MRKRAIYSLVGLSLMCGAVVVARRITGPRKFASAADGVSALYTNRLIHETSPYLLMHAHNPVDWYAWGDEAFEKARKEDKPIFLSIGYSTCHWCHVMEAQDFSDLKIAEMMNKYFVSIKVDREERPDIDDQYMTAVQMIAGGGGWPLSVFLTPEGKPFYGGTYFPPEEFTRLLTQIADMWSKRRDTVLTSADQIAEAVRQLATARTSSKSINASLVHQAVAELRASYDSRNGGFGRAPKFPPDMSLELLLMAYERVRQKDLLTMVTKTLDGMAMGGMYDQIGGGFHRYSVDAGWRTPHFEKMLYNQAGLMRIYADAYQITHNSCYGRIVREIEGFVEREMIDPKGGFYSALDADSPVRPGGEKEEGKFYFWTPAQVIEMLGVEEGQRFNQIYGITREGSSGDESLPHLTRPVSYWAEALGMSPSTLEQRLDLWRAKLLRARNRRPPPDRDDKIIVGWNGLMIGALAHAAVVIHEPHFVALSRKAASFVLSVMVKDGRLLHSYRSGAAKLDAYADDYAYLVAGLLDLYDATHESQWLSQAESLSKTLITEYWDKTNGGFFYTSNRHVEILARSKNPYDNALPSANSTMAQALLRLFKLTGDAEYRDKAAQTLRAFQEDARKSPDGFMNLILATAQYVYGNPPTSLAPNAGQGGNFSSASRVSAQLAPDHVRVAPGTRVQVKLVLRIADGWHINSHHPRQSYLVPTTIEPFPDASAVRLARVEYPEGKNQRFSFSHEELSVYDRTVTIPLTLIRSQSMATKERVQMKIRVQACSETTCLSPATVVASLVIE